MRKDSQTALTPIIARELAQRDGWVKALLVPRIEQLGESHIISLEATIPKNNILIAYSIEEVKTLESILPVFNRLARDIQSKLAKSTVNLQTEPLERVTTASLSALRLYSQANQLLLAGQAETAGIVLSLAINNDLAFIR